MVQLIRSQRSLLVWSDWSWSGVAGQAVGRHLEYMQGSRQPATGTERVLREQMLAGARALHDAWNTWGLAEAAAARCVTLQAACKGSPRSGRVKGLLRGVSWSRFWHRQEESFRVHSFIGALVPVLKGLR